MSLTGSNSLLLSDSEVMPIALIWDTLSPHDADSGVTTDFGSVSSSSSSKPGNLLRTRLPSNEAEQIKPLFVASLALECLVICCNRGVWLQKLADERPEKLAVVLLNPRADILSIADIKPQRHSPFCGDLCARRNCNPG